MSRQCPRCGHLAEDLDHFCASCGAELAPGPEAAFQTGVLGVRIASEGDSAPLPTVDPTSVGGLGRGHAVLVVLRGPQEGARFDLDPVLGTVVLGRAPECDLFLDDVTVSRRHAELARRRRHLGARRLRLAQRQLRQPSPHRPPAARGRRRGADRQVPLRLPRGCGGGVMSAVPSAVSRGLMGIGDVLEVLRPDFPDVTISKIRFLEGEGLIAPQRTASGYRKFSHADVERLRYVLACQRDQYLPLKVIREHLEAIDRGLEPPASSADGPRVPRALVSTDGMPSADSFRGNADVRLLTRRAPRGERPHRLPARAARGLRPHRQARPALRRRHPRHRRNGGGDGGVRHRAAAPAHLQDRGRPRGRAWWSRSSRRCCASATPRARQRADDAIRELAALSVRLHASLVKAGLATELRR